LTSKIKITVQLVDEVAKIISS